MTEFVSFMSLWPNIQIGQQVKLMNATMIIILECIYLSSHQSNLIDTYFSLSRVITVTPRHCKSIKPEQNFGVWNTAKHDSNTIMMLLRSVLVKVATMYKPPPRHKVLNIGEVPPPPPKNLNK
jgi:hypothetical protein